MDTGTQAAVLQLAGPTAVAAIGALGAFAAGHRSGRASFIKAVQDAAQQVITTLQAEVARLTTRCEASESAHRECEARVNELWAEIKGKPIPPFMPGELRGGAPEDLP